MNDNYRYELEKGFAYCKQDNLKEAMKCFDSVIKRDDKNIIAWRNKGNVLNILGKYKDAIPCFEKALKINSKDVESWSGKGFSYSLLENYEKALECYNQALRLNPKVGHFWYVKGVILNTIGRNSKAIKCLNRAIKINPRDAEYWSIKSDALEELGKTDEAKSCFEKGMKIYNKKKKVGKFEYKWIYQPINIINIKGTAIQDIRNIEDDNPLEEMGKKDWELVSVCPFIANGTTGGFYYFFKRESTKRDKVMELPEDESKEEMRIPKDAPGPK